MTIRFAPATTGALSARRLPMCKPVARAIIVRSIEKVSNDNAPLPSARTMNDTILRAALNHFAKHGLGAARVARAQALAAIVAKDKPDFDWWLGITHTLDRRLASEIERLAPDFS